MVNRNYEIITLYGVMLFVKSFDSRRAAVLSKSACFRAKVSASAHSRYPGGRGVLRDGMVVETEVIPPGRRRGPSAANDF